MRRIVLHINKFVHAPFYQAEAAKSAEQFHHEEYASVWNEAGEMGLQVSIPQRIEMLKEADSVTHIAWNGVDYFYNDDFDAYWEELAQLIEEHLKDL